MDAGQTRRDSATMDPKSNTVTTPLPLGFLVPNFEHASSGRGLYTPT